MLQAAKKKPRKATDNGKDGKQLPPRALISNVIVVFYVSRELWEVIGRGELRKGEGGGLGVGRM